VGSDTVLSDLPYHGTTACGDRTYREAPAEDAPGKLWWDFLIFWD
jgi:hypothetical protein